MLLWKSKFLFFLQSISTYYCWSSVAKPWSTLCDQVLQHASLLCPSVSPRVCPSSCPLSEWCFLTISSTATSYSFALNFSQHEELFQCVLCIRQPKYWNFSINNSPSNEYTALISFRIDWFDLLQLKRIFKSSLAL